MKELYIEEVEAIMAELIDSGVPEERAYDIASERAYDHLRDRLADRGDALKDRMKENGTWQKQ